MEVHRETFRSESGLGVRPRRRRLHRRLGEVADDSAAAAERPDRAHDVDGLHAAAAREPGASSTSRCRRSWTRSTRRTTATSTSTMQYVNSDNALQKATVALQGNEQPDIAYHVRDEHGRSSRSPRSSSTSRPRAGGRRSTGTTSSRASAPSHRGRQGARDPRPRGQPRGRLQQGSVRAGRRGRARRRTGPGTTSARPRRPSPTPRTRSSASRSPPTAARPPCGSTRRCCGRPAATS